MCKLCLVVNYFKYYKENALCYERTLKIFSIVLSSSLLTPKKVELGEECLAALCSFVHVCSLSPVQLLMTPWASPPGSSPLGLSKQE